MSLPGVFVQEEFEFLAQRRNDEYFSFVGFVTFNSVRTTALSSGDAADYSLQCLRIRPSPGHVNGVWYFPHGSCTPECCFSCCCAFKPSIHPHHVQPDEVTSGEGMLAKFQEPARPLLLAGAMGP